MFKSVITFTTLAACWSSVKSFPKYHVKKILRKPLKTDSHVFTRVVRNSKKWKRLYKKRSGIERMNGRIDRDFKFEKHTIRGLEKVTLFLTTTFIIKLTYAKAKIEHGIKSGYGKLYA